jgi:hypothetical protein
MKTNKPMKNRTGRNTTLFTRQDRERIFYGGSRMKELNCYPFTRILDDVLGEWIRESESNAEAMWSALAGITWEDTRGNTASFSFREAGGMVADIRDDGSGYMTWYCRSPHALVDPFIEAAMAKRGWTWRKIIDIPAGVTAIEDNAFALCGNLTAVTLPAGLTAIGEGAFSGCKNLAAINFSDSVTTIGNFAFSGCENLTAIVLPAGVTTIGDNAFYQCKNLVSITLPAGITTIGDDAFHECESLTDITLPAGIISIGDDAFHGCKSLTDITLPASVTDIGRAVFSDCKNLSKITVEKQNPRFTDIDGILFDNIENKILCYPARKKETHYITPSGITAVGDAAFSACKNLVTIDIPAGVTTIGDWAFSGCESLTTIDIPAGVTSIGEWAFSSCKNLDSITVEKQNPCFSDVNGILFDKIKNQIMCYPAGKQDACYAVPAGTTAVMDAAFSNCKSLMTIDIAASVTAIGAFAFFGCENLKTVYLSRKVSVPAWAFNPFENTSAKFVYTD